MIKHSLFSVLVLGSALATAGQTWDLDLEPCINGAVSARGEFPEQVLEDLAVLQNMGQQDEYALEPCMNGDVSASGLYVNQAVEDAVERVLASHR